MKKIILITLSTFFVYSPIEAQILRSEELENYAKDKYGEKWVDAATNLLSLITLDKNNAITYTQIIPAEGQTKDQLYVILNYWFATTFNDANSVIQLNDKDLGTIIAKGYVGSIAQHIGAINSYIVNIEPIIKCDIKDNKVRITYTVPFYSVTVFKEGGWFGIMDDSNPYIVGEKWAIDKCFPFAAKDSHKKTSGKALVMTHAYSNVIMDKIEECITNGLIGNENDDW